MNEELLRHHLAIIEQRWPQLAALLTVAQLGDLQVELCEGISSTLLVNGIQLTSRHDRVAEAELQAATLPDVPVLHLYGTGLGDLQKVLLARPRLKTLHVHIMHHNLFTLVLALLEHDEWLQDPRVELSLAADEQEIVLPFFALPSELELAEDAACRIRGRLVSEVMATYTRQRFTPDLPRITGRLAENVPLLDKDGDVATLFDSHPDATALVIASGPSLRHHLPRLAGLLQQHPEWKVLCVDTALAPLRQYGISVDLVVTIDDALTPDRLASQGLGSVPLVYAPMVPHETLTSWQGPRFTAYSISPVYEQLRKAHPKGLLHQGGSVIHPTVDLAVKMGSREIILLGCDFAFPGGQTHTGWDDGALGPVASQALSWVLDGHGQRVSTNPNFTTYQIELERYMASHPEVKFWNSSRDGAALLGCDYHPELMS
ncbi:motility associated factor glycosyltransferase family protein [Aeromonas allosaccharophila]|uniref:motility associated factor glycosyltransferase family protein n=1 Tax=Aeromonas allosaccharophila TaxID=656 RepID=UPI001BD0C3F3|nr:6-hydroxymethylpterin diphosphokinase MptE-like protein [Aeromonas allosaccharophila]MBS4694430.1 motility associated factor glycosyltransferase family protein [Aeromonas allosaccharophila]